MVDFARRKFTAVLVAFALLAGVGPTVANASPEKAVPAMVMSMSGGGMDCGQHMPMSDHKAPCNDSATCLGMLGCAAPVAVPIGIVAPIAILHVGSVWPHQLALDGFARQPALPPPIA